MVKPKIIIPVFLLLIFAYILILGCGPAIVMSKPPDPRIEVKSTKPHADAVWIDGHWKWSGGKYVWISGRWEQSKPGKTWIPGHWQQKNRGWVWIEGHWR